MNCADVFAMTSRRTKDYAEGFGIAVVEAALCGVPAVVAADCGLEEAIENGVTGVAVPQDAPDITAHAVLALLADETLRLRLGLAARDRAVRSQSWRTCAIWYDALLRKLGRGALVDDVDIATSA
jgi:phosphatidylinositol alpha-1,6-mannosyltransferase